jgi:hypothetical protein
MRNPYKPLAAFLTFIFFLSLPALACDAVNPFEDSYATPVRTMPVDEITPEPIDTMTAEEQAAYQQSIDNPVSPEARDAAIADPDLKLTCAFSGDNPSYHTGLRNRTIYYLDYDSNVVVAQESAAFEEPAGNLTRIGTDRITLNALYDPGALSFSGTLEIFTQGTATGTGDMAASTNTVTYSMSGEMWVFDRDGWAGTVTGSAVLEQVWPSELFADEITNYTIVWEVTCMPVE